MIQHWQEKIINGFKPGEMAVVTGGRQTGKSQMQAYMRMWNDIQQRPVEDLKLTEGTVYGSRYYCVEPVGGAWIDMEIWCMDAFGTAESSIWSESASPKPAQRWYMNNRRFWFRDEQDRLMFVMRWR